jgi:DNA-binding NarL/FixJ family response regulator
MTTILIADHHEVVRRGLRAIFIERPDWEVVAEAADGKEAVAQALKTTPNVAIVDYSLPLLNGVEVTKQIRKHSPDTAVLIFTVHDNNDFIYDSLHAGALGYVLKSDAQRMLMAAIHTVVQHKPFFTGIASAAMWHTFQINGSDSPVSGRERSVIQLVAEGHSNKKIASMLNLSAKTIETHRLAVRLDARCN